ncbi:ubiquitin ligase (cullin) of SCF [Marasmius crinis-equi]|uniref:Ubiquitin ligase (Cullin) of SCF n=1 Tax=Marasmius crinis-equi TaxID=585013 RepID=A0ABR3F2V9_9AGAR
MAIDVLTPVPKTQEERWDYLKAGADLIMLGEELSFTQYQELFVEAHNYCTWTPSSEEGDDTDRTAEQKESINPQEDLYSKLQDYFGPYYFEASRKQAEALHNEDLLKYYSSRWTSYSNGAGSLNRLFNYLYRSYIKVQARDGGRKDLYPVFQLALRSWREHFLSPLQQHGRKLTRALIQLAERHREGETIDIGLMDSVLSSLVSVGIDTENMFFLSLDAYKEHFETEFLRESEERYRKASETWRSGSDEHVQAAKARVQEENDYISAAGEYLRPETQEELRRRCEVTILGDLAGEPGKGTTQ